MDKTFLFNWLRWFVILTSGTATFLGIAYLLYLLALINPTLVGVILILLLLGLLSFVFTLFD